MNNAPDPMEPKVEEPSLPRRRGARVKGVPQSETVVRMPTDLLTLYQFLGRYVEGGQNRLLTWALLKAAPDLQVFLSQVSSVLGVPDSGLPPVPDVPSLESLFTVGRDVWVVTANGPERKTLWFRDGKVTIGE